MNLSLEGGQLIFLEVGDGMMQKPKNIQITSSKKYQWTVSGENVFYFYAVILLIDCVKFNFDDGELYTCTQLGALEFLKMITLQISLCWSGGKLFELFWSESLTAMCFL